MLVSDVLRAKQAPVECIRTDESIRCATHRLAAWSVEALVVVTPSGRVVGLISEHDVISALSRPGTSFETLGVVDAMTGPVTCCTPDDSLTDVLGLIASGQQRHVPVVDDGRVVGLLGVANVMQAGLDEVARETSVLRGAYLAIR